MTTGNDDTGDLVHRAYEAAAEPSAFDVGEGLREVYERARLSTKQLVPTAAQVVGESHVATSPVTDSRPVPGTIMVKTLGMSVTVQPGEGRTVVFGRDANDVDVPLGVDDRHIDRQHGRLTCHAGRWWLTNIGQSPIRVGSRLVYNGAEPLRLGDRYTSLLIGGFQGRVHLVELYVVGEEREPPTARPHDVTVPPQRWSLSATERRALVVVGQRYLRQEPHPRPLTWRQAAERLVHIDPDGGWTPKRVESVVTRVRIRLSNGVTGLTREEVGEPVGDSLRHNLITELVESTTLVPADLHLLDEPE